MSAGSDETIPQIALFIQESSTRPPPPPPAASSSVPRTSSRAPRPMILPIQHLLPPPPPPPPIVPSTSTSQIYNTVYRAPSPQPSTSFAICHPPSAVPEFDARRPPPPIPAHMHQNNTLKRSISNSCTAGPSKLRKTEEPKAEDALCDLCLQCEISIENYRIKMEKINKEDECQTLLFKKKLTEYQRQKDILRSLVDADIFRKVEEFGDDVAPYNFRIGSNSFNESFLTGSTSSINNQMRMQFMEYLFSEPSKFEPSPSTSVEDSLRQTLSTITRPPVRRSSPDLLQTLQEIMYDEDRLSSSNRPGSSEMRVERVHRPLSNGVSSLRRFTNGQRMEPRALPPPALLPPPASVPAQPPPAPFAPPAHFAQQAPRPAQPPHASFAPPGPRPPGPYPHYPPPRGYHPPPYMAEPRPSTSRAPVPPYPPYTPERYPSPHYYYK